MGYTIKIGQAEPRGDDSDDEEGGYHEYGYEVASLDLSDAPRAPGDTNPGKNYRWPSYSCWAEFAREVGLHEFFLGDDGVMRPHPGVIVLRKHHAETLRGALAAYRAKHPEAVARFDIHQPGMTISEEFNAPQQHPDCDYALARLEWVCWWVDWALANCTRPAMENS
jgi:hypothetical protein